MQPDQAHSLINQWEVRINAHDTVGLADLYSDDAVLTSPMFRTTKGRASIASSFEVLFASFPDWKVNISNVLVDGDQVAALTVASATDRLGRFGLPATGEPFSYRCVLLYTIRDAKIVAEERIYDLTALIDRLEKVRVERELRAASDVQRALFPRETQSGPYYDAAGDSNPCRAIGGDFFDFFELAGSGFGVALGDVSGKGPPAALLASLLQGMIAVESSRWQGPGRALSQINDALVRRRIEPRFATLSFVTISQDGRLTYSNAGHNPPLLVTDDEIRRLDVGGPMLGVFASATFQEATVELHAGDLTVIFSDGVTDALNPEGEEFGDERLLTFVRANRHHRPGALVASALDAVRDFSGGSVHSDDATLLALRYLSRAG